MPDAAAPGGKTDGDAAQLVETEVARWRSAFEALQPLRFMQTTCLLRALPLHWDPKESRSDNGAFLCPSLLVERGLPRLHRNIRDGFATFSSSGMENLLSRGNSAMITVSIAGECGVGARGRLTVGTKALARNGLSSQRAPSPSLQRLMISMRWLPAGSSLGTRWMTTANRPWIAWR